MKQEIEKAIDDIAVIKEVITRTQNDFSKIAPFFICIGAANVLGFIMEQLAYYFRNINGYGTGAMTFFTWASQMLPFVITIVCFLIFYRQIRARNNMISCGILQVWGIVLIGTHILEYLYMCLIPNGNAERITTMWRCKELIVILPIIIILLVTGILTQRKIITIVTGIYCFVYLVLFMGMKEVAYGTLSGSGTLVSVSSITIRIVMTVGMIILGLYLKKGERNGNKFNTGSVSDEA